MPRENTRPRPARSDPLGPGVSSAAELAGLPALRRRRPRTWHEEIKALTPAPPRNSKATVRAVFSSSANTQALPKNNSDFSRIKRPRACARRIVELVGDRPAVELNGEPQLAKLHRDLVAGGASASTANRTVALARRVLRPWCKYVGIKPRLFRRGRRRNRRVGPRGARPVPGPQEVGALLAVLDGPHRIALALAAGAGLLESEILGLRFEDIRLADGSVVVQTGGIRGRSGCRCFRVEFVADWAWKLLVATHVQQLNARAAGLLFPNRRNPRRPRSSFGPGLRRACAAVFGDGSGAYTLSAARRLWQRIQIDAGLPSAQSRQTWSVDDCRGGLPWWAEEAHGVARSWGELCRPPVDLRGRNLRVSRKKPKGCTGRDPELPLARGAESMALPDYCRARPLQPPRGLSTRDGHDAPGRPASSPTMEPSRLTARPAVLVQFGALPEREIKRLAEEISRRLTPEPQVALRPLPSVEKNRKQADLALSKQLRGIERQLVGLAREVSGVGRRRSIEDLVLAVLAGAGGGFAAQNADELAQRLQQALRSVGVPDDELGQLLPEPRAGAEPASWAHHDPRFQY